MALLALPERQIARQDPVPSPGPVIGELCLGHYSAIVSVGMKISELARQIAWPSR